MAARREVHQCYGAIGAPKSTVHLDAAEIRSAQNGTDASSRDASPGQEQRGENSRNTRAPDLLCQVFVLHRSKQGGHDMDPFGIILGVFAAAALLFLLIGMGLGVIRPPPLYGPPEKNGSTKVEPPKDHEPSR